MRIIKPGKFDPHEYFGTCGHCGCKVAARFDELRITTKPFTTWVACPGCPKVIEVQKPWYRRWF